MSRTISFLTAAVLACAHSGLSRSEQQEPASSGVAPITGSLLFMPMVEKIPGTASISTNFVGIAALNIPLREDLILAAGVRTDFAGIKPGIAQSQYGGVSTLALQWKPSPDLAVQLGTLPPWGAAAATPGFEKWTEPARIHLDLGHGGPKPGFIGLHMSKNTEINGVKLNGQAIVATGDRFVTPSVAGRYFPVLCKKANQQACGLVAGVKVKAAVTDSLALTAQHTFMDNGAGLNNEHRSSLAAEARTDIPGGAIVSGLVEVSYNNHFRGGPGSLNTMTAALSVQKPVGHGLTIDGYVSGTRASGAVEKDFAFAGVGITYAGKDKTIALKPYIGQERSTAGGKSMVGIFIPVTLAF